MTIYNQIMLNSLSKHTDFSFKKNFVQNLTDQQKKIYAIATLAIGLCVVCILSFIKKCWYDDKKVTNESKKLTTQTENPTLNDDISNETEAQVVKNKNDHSPNKADGVKDKTIPETEVLMEAQFPKIAIGKEQWKKYFGDIGNEPPLPKDIHKILESPCPFYPGKKVQDTHMLVLVPESINGKPIKLNSLDELLNHPQNNDLVKVLTPHNEFVSVAPQKAKIWINADIKSDGQQASSQSHWVLMTKDVIQGSINKSYAEQQALIEGHNKQNGMQYEIPNALDAAICIWMHYMISQERLFNDKPYTYAFCQEFVQGNQLVVGCFSDTSFKIHYNETKYGYDLDEVQFGVAPMLKLV